jgi:alkylation response protein AidB-like acyl-CoA dehydrogenase
MVPIRSRVDHSVFDGIQVGDMGHKLGYNTVDNGWLKFDNYRVPRSALL